MPQSRSPEQGSLSRDAKSVTSKSSSGAAPGRKQGRNLKSRPLLTLDDTITSYQQSPKSPSFANLPPSLHLPSMVEPASPALGKDAGFASVVAAARFAPVESDDESFDTDDEFSLTQERKGVASGAAAAAGGGGGEPETCVPEHLRDDNGREWW
eukprot:gene34887-27879_t